jgi:hypothetical protein
METVKLESPLVSCDCLRSKAYDRIWLENVTSQRDCRTILDVDVDYLFPHREVTLRIGCGTLRSPFPGEFQPIPREVEKSPASFSEADVAVIIMNCFVIAPMFAPPTKSSSEMLFHGLRKYPIINTSGKRIDVEVE